MKTGDATVVKVFVDSTTADAAIITTADNSIRYRVVLEEKLQNKMNRKDRAYFNATLTDKGVFALHKRVPNQKW